MVMFMEANKEMLNENCETFVTFVGIFGTIYYLIFKLNPVIFTLDPVTVPLWGFPTEYFSVF